VEGYSAGRVLGPLAPYAAGFVVELMGRGYRPRSVSGQLELMAHLSRWLVEQGLEPDGLAQETAERFLTVRRQGHVSLRSWRALGPLVGYLRGLGVVPERVASADTPVERLLLDYRDYLVSERGLTAGSVAHWERVAKLFLAARSEPLGDALRGLTTGEVTGFVVARCARALLGLCGEDPDGRVTVAASLSACRWVDGDPVDAGSATRDGQPTSPLFPSRSGRHLSRGAIWRRVVKHTGTAQQRCPSLATKNITPHVLRHTAAMQLLQAPTPVDTATIALWLGHETLDSTNKYLHADMELKRRALDRTTPANVKPGRYRPPDKLLAFLEGL
jgi:Phage integrase family